MAVNDFLKLLLVDRRENVRLNLKDVANLTVLKYLQGVGQLFVNYLLLHFL